MADEVVWRNKRNSAKNDGASSVDSQCNGSLKFSYDLENIDTPYNIVILKTKVGDYYTIEGEEIVKKDINKDVLYIVGTKYIEHEGYGVYQAAITTAFNTFSISESWSDELWYSGDPGVVVFEDNPSITLLKKADAYQVITACAYSHIPAYSGGIGVGVARRIIDINGSQLSPVIGYSQIFSAIVSAFMTIFQSSAVQNYADDNNQYNEIYLIFLFYDYFFDSYPWLNFATSEISGFTESFYNEPDASYPTFDDTTYYHTDQRMPSRGTTHFATVFYDINSSAPRVFSRTFGIFLNSSPGGGPVYSSADPEFANNVSGYHDEASNTDWFYVYKNGAGVQSYSFSGLRWSNFSVAEPSHSMSIWEYNNGLGGEDQIIVPIIIGCSSTGVLWALPDSDPGTPGYQWSISTGYTPVGSPIVENGGNIYLPHSTGLACYSIFGVFQWDYSGHVPNEYIAIGSDGNIYFTSENRIVALTNGSIPDPLEIISTSPANDSTDISVDSIIEITFNQSVNTTTISSTSIQIELESGSILPYSWAYAEDSCVLTLTPSATLPSSNQITVKVSTSVLSNQGTSLDEDFYFIFTTVAIGLDETSVYPPVLYSPNKCRAKNVSMIFEVAGPTGVEPSHQVFYKIETYSDAGATSLVDSKDSSVSPESFEWSTDRITWTTLPSHGVGPGSYDGYIRVIMEVPLQEIVYLKTYIGAEDA